MLGIGIESTCDETGIALTDFTTGKPVLIKNALFSQISNHEKFGGIVPEIASRKHLAKIHWLLEEIIQSIGGMDKLQNNLKFISVSSNPGLLGSLLIGNQVAASLASIWNVPLIGVNHLEAHLNAWLFDDAQPFDQLEFPAAGILLSGGNTAIFNYRQIGIMELSGQTLDDAVGEALDKAAKILGIGYPGGPIIEKKAALSIQDQIGKNPFPILMKKQTNDSWDFSYSGIKTALVHFTRSNPGPYDEATLNDICYWFQTSCFELVVRNISNYLSKNKVKSLLPGGGVFANATLRKMLKEKMESTFPEIKVWYPSSPKWCTDNGAMIAAMGYLHYKTNTAKSEIPAKLSTTMEFQENRSAK